MEPVQFTPIGTVRNAITDIYYRGFSDIESQVAVDPALEEGLDGIEEYSHLQVIFYFHRLERERVRLKRRPWDREDAPEMGVFALRTQLRPTPIGSSVVRLLLRAGNVLWVRGLDAIDGTPVLDIKPFDLDTEALKGLHIPPWLRRLRDTQR
ncbi:MAG: tRNA (N6-threonylcarbamoyladenosine(37)-N6)-methyltransferase TrmO [Chloroflexi bacterium]|nr:tRNA (N6-threonylcarbamoyladenosine(37)-N6)-methyltransferase TrmO [Chloroflexota bacterium]